MTIANTTLEPRVRLPVVVTTAEADLAAFDELPSELREMVRNAPLKLASARVAAMIKRRGEQSTIAFGRCQIAEMWRALGTEPLRP